MLSNTAVPKYYGQFREAVMRGEIPVCETVSLEMNRIDELIANPGIYYDPEPVEGWIRFCENELTLTDGSDLHLLDTFKLWGEQVYGVLFWAVTIIDCPEDIKDVRLAVGSNSASMWWLNGEETLLLSGDRRMVKDDAMSSRVTLKKGRNVLRGAIINGPGMSDFCVRFLDEKGNPVTNYSIINNK